MYSNNGPNLSDLDHTLMMEQYGGAVDSQFAAASIMRQFFAIRPVRGTDTIRNDRVGKTVLKKLEPGKSPPADATPFGKVTLTVDTVVLARDTQAMLNTFQTHFNVRDELGKDHGKQIAKFFDEAFMIAAIKGALAAAPVIGDDPSRYPIGAGKVETLLAGEDLDPDKLEAAISNIVTKMEEEDVPTEDLVIFVRPTTFQTLLGSNKLVSSEFSSDNADFAKRTLYKIAGVRIEKTTALPKAEIKDHFLSNERNNNFYDLSADQARAIVVILSPKGLLAGETIPLQSDVYWEKTDKTWYIDSWLAFGVTVNRPDCCGAVFRAA